MADQENYKDRPSSVDLEKMLMDKEWYPGSPKDWNPKNLDDSSSSNKKQSGDVTILRGGKDPEVKKFSKGGAVRGDGVAARGKTKGRII